MAFIEANNVTKIYNGHIMANKGLSFSIEQGEIIGLLGKNGAGKTTLISLLSNEFPPTSGSIHINGIPIDKVDPNWICTVQQEFGLFDFMTVYDHLRYFSILRSNRKSRITEPIIQEVIDQLKLEKLLNRKTISLSGGEKRRVLIAISLLADAEILILDKPTANLDIQWKNKVIDLLFYLNKIKKKTILYSSHSIEEVEKITDKVLIMNQGSIMHYDKIKTILAGLAYSQKIIIKATNRLEAIQQKIEQAKKAVYILTTQLDGTLYFTRDDSAFIHTLLADENILFSQLPITLEDLFKFTS
ncbi:ABC transporter ATP-binding protein [Spirosoma harenae]